MAATNAAYNFWLYELCDVYIVRHHYRASASLLTAGVKTGSDEAHDRPICAHKIPNLSSTDALHMSGSWTPAAASIYALCNRRVMATPRQTAK